MYFFFCKQKTAYEMRISDWSSDVCSSDLCDPAARAKAGGRCDDRGGAATAGRRDPRRGDARGQLHGRSRFRQTHPRGGGALAGRDVGAVDVFPRRRESRITSDVRCGSVLPPAREHMRLPMASHRLQRLGEALAPPHHIVVAYILEHRPPARDPFLPGRSEEHTSELQSLMRISYA